MAKSLKGNRIVNDMPARLLSKINQYVSQNQQHIVRDLQQILRFKTVSGGATDEERQTWQSEIHNGFNWLETWAESQNLHNRNLENSVFVIEQSGGENVLGVLLHLDVVPPGEGWSHPPFEGEIDNGVVYGRGCQDDKGPIVQMMHALAAIKTLGLPFRRTVRLIVGSEEETGVWADVKRYLELERAPDFSIVPDGSFPIVNGEKGMIDIKISVSPSEKESGDISLVSAISGLRSNVVPPLAEVILKCATESDGQIRETLARFLDQNSSARAEMTRENEAIKINFYGRNAHGSMPWEGQNAARDALHFLAHLPLQGPRAQFAHLLAALTGGNEGAELGIANRHNFLKQTTQSLGILRINESTCEGVLNIRHTPPQTVSLILDRVTHAARTTSDSATVPEVEVVNNSHDPLFIDPQHYPEYFSALEAAYQAVTGREPLHVHTGGTTFAKAFPNAMCFGPTDKSDEPELAHQADERIAVEHLLRNVRIYALALALLALDLSKME